ncbi:hypothetical protein [Pseudomonas prosekii]|uniref:hypothetical protein n=1 Tax=Pseudomonas prosekii TaxID=1148509 RepID=UPI003F7530EB
MTIDKDERATFNNVREPSAPTVGGAEASDVLAENISSVTKTLEVTHYNDGKIKYKGELTFAFNFEPRADGLNTFTCESLQYRITKFNNQSGGHKANLHFSFDSMGNWWGNDSPDALWQDGEWHSYNIKGAVVADSSARVYARFVFDSGGNDPTASNQMIVSPDSPVESS